MDLRLTPHPVIDSEVSQTPYLFWAYKELVKCLLKHPKTWHCHQHDWKKDHIVILLHCKELLWHIIKHLQKNDLKDFNNILNQKYYWKLLWHFLTIVFFPQENEFRSVCQWGKAMFLMFIVCPYTHWNTSIKHTNHSFYFVAGSYYQLRGFL